MNHRDPNRVARERVPIILAVGLVVAINLICFAVVYDALFHDDAGLSENSTQILSTTFGGIIGVLGAALGFRQGREAGSDRDDDPGPATSSTSGRVRRRGTRMSQTAPETEPEGPDELRPDPATTPDEEPTPEPDVLPDEER